MSTRLAQRFPAPRPFSPGARLPPHRDLADHLGVTVTTITRAYAEASRRGLISGHVGRGTFIRGAEPDESEYEPGVLDLSINILMPDKEVAHLEAHLFQRRTLPWTQLLGYAPKRGHLRHRGLLGGDKHTHAFPPYRSLSSSARDRPGSSGAY